MDLVRKAKQVDYLVDSLPVPEPEEVQVSTAHRPGFPLHLAICTLYTRVLRRAVLCRGLNYGRTRGLGHRAS